MKAQNKIWNKHWLKNKSTWLSKDSKIELRCCYPLTSSLLLPTLSFLFKEADTQGSSNGELNRKLVPAGRIQALPVSVCTMKDEGSVHFYMVEKKEKEDYFLTQKYSMKNSNFRAHQ